MIDISKPVKYRVTRTHCPKGHEYTELNRYYRKGNRSREFECRCNSALGQVRDDPANLRRALAYLDSYSAQNIVQVL